MFVPRGGGGKIFFSFIFLANGKGLKGLLTNNDLN